MKKSTVAMLGVVAATLASPALAMSAPSTFQEAYQKGAEARVEFKVIDDLGFPVSGATVNVFFDMVDRGMGRRIIGETDTNGVYVAEAKTMGVLEIKVSREGYYSSTDRISFIDMGREHDVKGGRWQPWGMQKEIVLRPVRNPVAIRIPVNDWRTAKDMYKWLGFDLLKYDFLPPHGNGEYADIELRFNWNGKRFKGYEGIDEHIRFPNKYSGAYYVDRSMQSDFKDVYVADSNAVYQTEFDFYEHPVYDKKGMMTRRDTKELGSSRALVVRSRCKTDDEGNLVSANYFLLSDLQFGGSDKGACLIYQGVYNPTPNDTNLEPK